MVNPFTNLGTDNGNDDYLTVWLRNGGTTERPNPALDSKSISTPSLLFLKYCPIITSRLFWAIEIPVPMNSPVKSQ